MHCTVIHVQHVTNNKQNFFPKSIKKCSDIYTEIKSYSIGQIFLILAKFSLYLSIIFV